MVLELRLGDVLRLKKAHPCGGDLWEVVRLGADIGVRCRKCDRYVLHPRSYLQRRVREVVRTPAKPGASDGAPGE
jgi:hypothetical protein